jgi:tetratricopeptide (TPR) repeat protein
MSRSSKLGCLAVAILLPVLPAIAQPQSLMSEGSASGRGVATAETSSREPVGAPAAQLPLLSAEQAADLQYFHQRYQAAIEEYKKVGQPSAAVWNKMGIAYQMLYDLKDADRCYKRAHKMDARNTDVLNNLGTVQDSMMDFAEAEKSYREALQIDPNSATILRNLGTNLIMQHKHEQGAAAYKQALALDPHIFDASSGPTAIHPSSSDERGTTNYFKAKSCARAGLDDCALTYLRKAFDEGSATIKKVDKESDFDRLRTTDAYARLVALEQ